MAFTITNLTQPGKGGGFYGDGRTCTWKNWRVEEHGLVSHQADGVTVKEEHPPQCMLGIDLYAERTELDDDKYPQFQTQWYGIGQLPLARLEALGWPLAKLQAYVLKGPGGQEQWKRRLQNPGGFQPSADCKTPSTSGSFFGSDPSEKVYEGSGYWQITAEVIGLGKNDGDAIEDRLMAHGVAALEGLVAVAGKKDMPKSKAAQKKEDQARQMGVQVEQKDTRQILVPVEIIKWPWQAEAKPGAGVPATAAQASAPAPGPVGVPNQAPAPAAAVPAPAGSVDPSLDKRIAAVIIGLLGKQGGQFKRASATLAVPVMKAFNADPKMHAATHRSYSVEFLSGDYNGLLWNFDPQTEIVKLPDGVTAEDAAAILETLG